MNPEQFIHPITKEPCSRQRRYQVLLTLAGNCQNHKGVPSVRGTLFCQGCLDKHHARLGNDKPIQYRPDKRAWKDVNWGLSDRAIAAALGVSVSAVYSQRRKAMMPQKPKVEKLREHRKPISKQPTISHQQKERARSIFRDHVHRGAIKRKPCAICNDPKTEGHHFDYTKPLEVIWLCKRHHHAVHQSERNQATA